MTKPIQTDETPIDLGEVIGETRGAGTIPLLDGPYAQRWDDLSILSND